VDFGPNGQRIHASHRLSKIDFTDDNTAERETGGRGLIEACIAALIHIHKVHCGFRQFLFLVFPLLYLNVPIDQPDREVDMPADKPTDPNSAHQYERFKELARELGCDEDEAKFEAALKRISEAPTPPKYEPKKRRRLSE
jgi:hypothetical protein